MHTEKIFFCTLLKNKKKYYTSNTKNTSVYIIVSK
ncbi:hypothetical protein FDZ58_04785 [Ehrlichia ruminantium]|nr:hypothetical protein FDZ68_04780 [Ehrlichia ruminantium]QLK51926.1 hypothetical protein FDZ66_04780 [Ehrlichia ruminantium]QLK52836.1 hypothetical protein FDZ65_04755 [Ehrlichia ruminantium]QLK53759.1 hypothetical protein FDZ64_04780 [Ehrlichia ruminantium]QLK54670.1 hypothetical protein FDZ63_04765 [Ehrlichia ruminantium]